MREAATIEIGPIVPMAHRSIVFPPRTHFPRPKPGEAATPARTGTFEGRGADRTRAIAYFVAAAYCSAT
jgi:hypothetical protein